MALTGRSEQLKHVPWLSPKEWYRVFKDVYSHCHQDQTNAYETLLAWKARIPKLPVGVDCTLTILQVCIKDREWMSKINEGQLPVHYENDLCLMYSTAIMRLLNHISHILQSRHFHQSSLYRKACQLKIPDWIVDLRHDVAHGHTLPTIDVMRTATNILLEWLHTEYWMPEAVIMQNNYNEDAKTTGNIESEKIDAFIDLMEIWTSVNLYIHGKYNLVSDIPDEELKDTLEELKTYATNLSKNNNKTNEQYTLTDANIILLSEISRYLGQCQRSLIEERIIRRTLLDNDAFLPNEEIWTLFTSEENTRVENLTDLPLNIIKFWQDVLILLQENNMVESLLFKLLKFINEERNSDYKRHIASLWVNCIAKSFIKVNVLQRVYESLEYKMTEEEMPNLECLTPKLDEKIESAYPTLKNVFSFNLSTVVPRSLTDIKFLITIIINPNEFISKFIDSLLVLVTPKLNPNKKSHLIRLLSIYNTSISPNHTSDRSIEKIHTMLDINKILKKCGSLEKCPSKEPRTLKIADQEIRNGHWKTSSNISDDQFWANSPIGLLPWQINNLGILQLPETCSVSSNTRDGNESEIIPGIIESENLALQSQIDWNKIFNTRKFKKRYQKSKTFIMRDRALKALRNRR